MPLYSAPSLVRPSPLSCSPEFLRHVSRGSSWFADRQGVAMRRQPVSHEGERGRNRKAALCDRAGRPATDGAGRPIGELALAGGRVGVQFRHHLHHSPQSARRFTTACRRSLNPEPGQFGSGRSPPTRPNSRLCLRRFPRKRRHASRSARGWAMGGTTARARSNRAPPKPAC